MKKIKISNNIHFLISEYLETYPGYQKPHFAIECLEMVLKVFLE